MIGVTASRPDARRARLMSTQSFPSATAWSSQIPALIVSLSAGLLVSKGGTRGSAEQAVLRQLGGLSARGVRGCPDDVRAGGDAGAAAVALCGARRRHGLRGLLRCRSGRRPSGAEGRGAQGRRARRRTEAKESVKESLKTAEIELALGSQLSVHLLSARGELAHRVSKIRKKFAAQYGFVIPEIKLTDNLLDRAEGIPDPDP